MFAGAVSLLYAARRTLILSFDDDSIDESAELRAALQGCPGISELRLSGTHVTPLTPELPPLPPAPGSESAPSPDAQFAGARDAILSFLEPPSDAPPRAPR